jgi:3-phenylpropionate/cinnamic acid dioxygenase small subunit
MMSRLGFAGAVMALVLAAGCSPAQDSASPAPAAPAASSFAEDRALIEDLQGRYMFALDWRNEDAYAATFAPDGEMDSAAVTGKGRDAIRQEIIDMKAREAKRAQETGKPVPRMRHNITNVALDVDGDRAHGRAYWTSYTNANGKPELNGYGHYEDEMIKIDGKWYFVKRKIFNEFAPGREAPAEMPK